jgi:hypothetical protein
VPNFNFISFATRGTTSCSFTESQLHLHHFSLEGHNRYGEFQKLYMHNMGSLPKKWFHQFYNYHLVLSLSNGTTMLVKTLVIPLYVTYFHKYIAAKSQSSKDLIPNIKDRKGMYYLYPSLPFHRARDSSWIYFASACRGC